MKLNATQKKNKDTVSANAPLLEIHELIDKSKRVLVASHIDPDGDAIGTQLAFAAYLRSLQKEVFLIREAPVPAKYRFLPDSDKIVHIDSYPDDFSVDTAVVLECPHVARTGKAEKFLKPETVIINIDHHSDSGFYGTVNWVEPGRSSVGEMVYELFLDAKFEITPEIATQLYTAILTDTGRFRFLSTSPRTMKIAGDLIAAGANPKEICDLVYFNLSPSTMKLTAKVLNTIEFFDNNYVCMLTLTNKMLEETGADMSESDGLVDFTLSTAGVGVGVLLKEQDAHNTRVSLRSRDGINVAELAARFGGGGHFNASGCTIPKSLEEAKQELLRIIKEVSHG